MAVDLLISYVELFRVEAGNACVEEEGTVVSIKQSDSRFTYSTFLLLIDPSLCNITTHPPSSLSSLHTILAQCQVTSQP